MRSLRVLVEPRRLCLFIYSRSSMQVALFDERQICAGIRELELRFRTGYRGRFIRMCIPTTTDGGMDRRVLAHQGPVRRHFTAAHRSMLCAVYRPELSVYKAVRGAKGAVFIPWIIIAPVSCTNSPT